MKLYRTKNKIILGFQEYQFIEFEVRSTVKIKITAYLYCICYDATLHDAEYIVAILCIMAIMKYY